MAALWAGVADDASRLAVILPFCAVAMLVLLPAVPAAASPGADPCVYRDERGVTVISDGVFDPRCPQPAEPAAFRPPGRLRVDLPMAQIIALVHQVAVQQGVDHRLVESLVEMESSFDPNALSHKGAMGLMQLMPAVARHYGASNPFDPWQNVEAGVRHLRELLDHFGADLERAVAAYNAGAGAVERYGGVPPYRETQGYVRKVLIRYRQRVQGLQLH
jgi:soluble lytic murein transglycosylase-like protein